MKFLTEFVRTENTPWAENHQIYLARSGVKLELTIPHHGVSSVAAEGDTTGKQGVSEALAEILNEHERFMLSVQSAAGKREEEIRHQAREEVKAISLFFPEVRSRNMRICMAAWLGIFCTVDDIVEDLPLGEAEHALRESIAALAGPRMCRDASHCSSPNDVLRLVSKLREHCEKYILESAAKGFFREISATFDAYIQEMKFRQGQLPNDLSTYMRIRTNSIGIAPFFSLINNDLYPDANSSVILDELQHQMNEVVGLQNDLLGLKKDIEKGEIMNAVIIAMRNKGGEDNEEDLRETATMICNLHNRGVSRVMERCKSLAQIGKEGQPSNSEAIPANMQLFLETHFIWCRTSGRYQTSVE